MDKPKISVIIPVRNEADRIEHCLRAVFSQSLEPYEVIVVDGHSTDGTVKKAERFPAKICYEEYHNRAGGCQVGIENAEGDYLAFTDADCVPDKHWLANLVKEFDEGIAGVSGRLKGIGKGLWIHSINLAMETFLSGSLVRLHSLKKKRYDDNLSVISDNGMCRRKDILQVGGFNTSLTGGEDIESTARLRQLGKLLYTPEAVVLHNHGRGLKSYAIQSYRYGGWRRESKVWGFQAIPPIVTPLIFLSLIFTRWVFLGVLISYLAAVLIMGIRFAIQERNIKYIFSIPVVYIAGHSFYIIGFWKEIVRPRKKGVPWK
ncbi:glycosyltransferase [Chloroflexota bacterium]